MSCSATKIVKVAHDSKFGDKKCGRDSVDLLAWCDPRRGAEDRLHPSCKIRLGTNGETSRVST